MRAQNISKGKLIVSPALILTDTLKRLLCSKFISFPWKRGFPYFGLNFIGKKINKKVTENIPLFSSSSYCHVYWQWHAQGLVFPMKITTIYIEPI